MDTDALAVVEMLTAQITALRTEMHDHLADVETRLTERISAIPNYEPRIAVLETWRSRQSGFIAGVAAIMSVGIMLIDIIVRRLLHIG